MNNLEKEINNLSTKRLKEIAIELMKDFRDGSDLVFDLIIESLKNRLTEQEFILFCENL